MGKGLCTRSLPALFGAGALALFLGSFALAAWRATGQSLQILTVAPFRTQIVEEYEEPESVYGGMEVSKVVYVENTGQVPAIVRVNLEVAFGDLDEEGSFVRDDSLSPEVVELSIDETGLWAEEEGWYYYTKVLGPGQRTEVPLMDSFRLREDLPDSYRRKQGRIFVRMESLQADREAASLWKTQSIHWELAYQEVLFSADPVTVRFVGPTDGFAFEGESQDIFMSFRYLTPGCARSQLIQVENTSKVSGVMTLRAISQKQGAMSEEEEELLRSLLEKDVAICIQDKKGVLYKGPVSGNLTPEEGEESMGAPLSLGSFSPGQKKSLLVSLAVSPQMDTKGQRLLGKVRWEWECSGGNGEYPDTGDETQVLLYALLSGGALLVILALWSEDRKKRSPVAGRKR